LTGEYHVTVPTSDPLAASDWYVRIFDFATLLIEERENEVIEERENEVMAVFRQWWAELEAAEAAQEGPHFIMSETYRVGATASRACAPSPRSRNSSPAKKLRAHTEHCARRAAYHADCAPG
jgi:hypothetical protein